MLAYPPGKINLGLHVTRRRPDGYHDLDTVFYPSFLTDLLEINFSDKDQLTLTGLPVPGNAESNLVLKALNKLRERFDIPQVQIHLHKVIPTGSGMGGGSSDATSVLLSINELCQLGADAEELKEIALELGSDCPFFLVGKASIGKGRGELLSPIDLNLSGFYLVHVFPGIHISTAQAFQKISPVAGRPSPSEIIKNHSVDQWKHHLINDFEKAIFPDYPRLPEIIHSLYEKGALLAMMSGSGSSVFGLFREMPADLYFEGCMIKSRLL